MKKKTIIIASITIIILAIILLIIGINSRQINLIKETANAQYTTKIGETEYNITNQILASSKIKPSLSAGMIPIKWDGENFIITREDSDWYDYESGQPAYIMLNDGTYQSELVQDMTDKKLANENIGAQIPVGNDAIVVPRINIHVDTTICRKRSRRNNIYKTRK